MKKTNKDRLIGKAKDPKKKSKDDKKEARVQKVAKT